MSSETIYELLLTKTDKTHDVKKYCDFLEHCSITNIFLIQDFYTEIHHILPKSLFPQYKNLNKNRWNSIRLTFHQHLVAHSILSKIFNGKMKSAYAFMLSNIPKIKEKFPTLFNYAMNLAEEVNVNIDRKLYKFERLTDSYVTEPMTRKDFSERHSLKRSSISALFGNNPRQFICGWKLYGTEIIKKEKKKSEIHGGMDKNLYRFQNIETNFITSEMTRLQFSKLYNIDQKFLYAFFFKVKPKQITHNWRLYKEGDPIVYEKPIDKRSGLRHANSDKNLYRFQCIDTGHITPLITRSEFIESYDVNIRTVCALFGKRCQKISNGWKIFNE